MDDDLGRRIAIGTGVAVGVLTVVILLWLWWRHVRSTASIRARRKSAILAGAVVPGTPFELAGAGRADPLQLHLDIHVHVLGGADVEVSFETCGVRLSYEVIIDGARIAGGELKLPPDATALGPHVRATDTIFPSQRTRVRCTVAVGSVLSIPAGSRVTLRGLATALPNNEVRGLTAWIG